MSKIIVVNNLNDGLSIEFTCGENEYTLAYDEEVEIKVSEDDYMYLDVVYKEK